MEPRNDVVRGKSLREQLKDLKRNVKDDRQQLINFNQLLDQLKPQLHKLENKRLPQVQNKMGRLLGEIQVLGSEGKHKKQGQLQEQYNELEKQQNNVLEQRRELRERLDAAQTERNALIAKMHADTKAAKNIAAEIRKESDVAFHQARREFLDALELVPADAPSNVADFYDKGKVLLLEIDKEYQRAARNGKNSFHLDAHTDLLKDAKNLLQQPHNESSHNRIHQIADKYSKGKFAVGRAVLGAALTFLGAAALVVGVMFSAPSGGFSLLGSAAGYLLFNVGLQLIEQSSACKVNAAAHKFAFSAERAPETAGEIQQNEEERSALVLSRA